MDKIIEKFCKKPTISQFNKLSKNLQEQLIKICFDVLTQKTGDQKKAVEILRLLDQIEVIYGYNVYTGDMKLEDPIDQFKRTGVVTIPIIPKEEIPKIQNEFDNTLKEFPEYLRDPYDPTLNSQGEEIVYSLGGFAALGNPSSFHNTFVRKLRIRTWKKVIKFFNIYIRGYHNKDLRKNYKIELLWDRMMYRKTGQKAVAEAWHRDVMPSDLILKTDEIYGGWINLDLTDQYFSCIPGSHLEIIQKDIPSGFDTLLGRESANLMKDEKVRKEVKNMTKDKREKYLTKLVQPIMKDVSAKRQKFVVPPGHIVIFPQYIMHEVVADAVKNDMRRLFFGWRMTVSDKSLRDNEKIMNEQSVPPLPGGMIPPMYAASHQSQQLGIPTIQKMTNTQKKQFDLNKWASDLNEKYLALYSTKRMKELSEELSKTKKNKRIREIIIDMNIEYLKQAGIDLKFNKDEFLIDDDYTISFRSVFRTNPKDDSTKTTMIKWSRDTIPAKILINQTYSGGGGTGTYMKAPRYMKSLFYYGLKMYPKYTEQEKIIYRPNRVS